MTANNCLTVLERPTAMLQSQYGYISYQEWCEKEIARIRAAGRPAALVCREGKVCIAIDK